MVEYYFNASAATTRLKGEPLRIFAAINEGHQAQTAVPTGRCPFHSRDEAVTEAKIRDHREVHDYLTADNLEPLRRKLLSNPQFAGLDEKEAAELKASIAKIYDVDMVLVKFASKANLLLSQYLLEPLGSSLQGSKVQIMSLMNAIRRAPGAPEFTEETALERFIFGIKKVSFNAALQFWSMLRLIPNVYKEQYKRQISRAEFMAAVKNIPKLLEDYASSNLGYFYAFKDFTIKNFFAYQRLLQQVYPGKDYLSAVRELATTEDAPVFDTYDPKFFDLLETANGHQLVNNEIALRAYAQNVALVNQDWSDPAPGQEHIARLADRLRAEFYIAHATPTLKCPALNIKLQDGTTLFMAINNWLEKMTEVFIMPAFDEFGIFRDSNSPV